MNAFLARTLGILNAVVGSIIVFGGAIIAILILVGASIEGLPFSQLVATSTGGLFIFLGAIIFAALFCGLLAILAEIERHLREIKQNNFTKPEASRPKKSTPTLE